MFDALKYAGPIILLLFAVGVPMWRARSAIRAWHLAVLLVLTVLSVATALALREAMLLALLVGLVAALLAGVLVLATILMLVAHAYPSHDPGDDTIEVQREHAVRFNESDHSRNYLVPQVTALLAAGWLAKSGLYLIALPVAVWFAALSWVVAQRRLRQIRNTPTSRIASAAQGLVELKGYGLPTGEAPLTSPLRSRPCIWFRYCIEERRGDNWSVVESATSDEPFLLDDGSSIAVVRPAGAQVQTRNKLLWRNGERRYTEEWIFPKARLYLLGELASENPAAYALDARKDTSDLLGQWKGDQVALRARFDSDRDGEISLAEWQAAQKQAALQVAGEHAQVRALPATHVVRAPGGNRAFIIGDAAESDITDKARRSALLRMGWFALVLGGSTYAVVRGTGRVFTQSRRAGAEARGR